MFSGSVFAKKNEDKLILASTGLVLLVTVILIAFIIINTISDDSISNKHATEQTAETTDSPDKKPTSDHRSSDLIKQFARLNVFSQPVTSPSRNLKKTRLSLSLHGIIDADIPETSVVIVSAGKSSPETAYRIGDTLPGGARLKEVYKDHVVLLNRGAKESLFLSQTALKPAEAKLNNISQPPATKP